MFDMIVAVDEEGGIGKQGSLPWRLKGDLQYFRTLTMTTTAPHTQNAVIMGRKTWESLPEKFRPLPGRLNVVLTTQADYCVGSDVRIAASLQGALALLRHEAISSAVENIFVIGGASVYRQALDHPGCRKIFLTKIYQRFACDTFFPRFSDAWEQESCSDLCTEETLTYQFFTYRNRQPLGHEPGLTKG